MVYCRYIWKFIKKIKKAICKYQMYEYFANLRNHELKRLLLQNVDVVIFILPI